MISTETISRLNADPMLRRWGRLLDADILVDVGGAATRIVVRDGQILRASEGPFVMPSCTVALHAEPEAWARFMAPAPTPGYQDLMALVRRGALRVEGDLRPFMQHLFWFKFLFARLREFAP
jgi:hypothetical protein